MELSFKKWMLKLEFFGNQSLTGTSMGKPVIANSSATRFERDVQNAVATNPTKQTVKAEIGRWGNKVKQDSNKPLTPEKAREMIRDMGTIEILQNNVK